MSEAHQGLGKKGERTGWSGEMGGSGGTDPSFAKRLDRKLRMGATVGTSRFHLQCSLVATAALGTSAQRPVVHPKATFHFAIPNPPWTL